VPFLKKRLRPIPRHDAGRLKKWLADLESDDFETRHSATTEIERLGARALVELERAVLGKNDLDKQMRLTKLLRAARDDARPFGTPDKLRVWRALEVLERAGTPEALALLRELAAGAPGPAITEEARAAVARLAPKPPR
jgi:HEAT repeat protein